jgi:drug/metabolite transporter (DMT)-like permease
MREPSRFRAMLLALLVTFLWSTSWVLIKRGLEEIPPITFAGLRYGIAFLILLPAAWARRRELLSLSRRDWATLVGLGLVFYALTQGGQFVTLRHLDAITFSLILSLTPILVALVGGGFLGERPSRLQWAGVALALGGGAIYFLPSIRPDWRALGFLLAGITVAANAGAALLGRFANRRRVASPLIVTTISMGVGAVCLLGLGAGLQGLPPLRPSSWGIILWLAVANTALAFTLWNRTLRALSAMESSVINNTMLIQIAVLAWLFLGESLTAIRIAGLAVVAIGTLLVQLRTSRRADTLRAR